ncbi:hypothetical protein V8E53_005528 [Lactarius tabidus]
MFLLTETTLFHWDSSFEFIHHRSNDLKKDFTGVRKVQSWMAKLQSTGLTFPPTQGSSASACSLATTVANTNHTVSSESQPLVTPARSSSDGVGHRISDVKASNSAYCDSVGKPSRYNEHIPSWFTSAATSALTSLFASDVAFLECDNQVMFASEMLEHYHFLYSDSLSKDHMEWTGMWCGPLFLQVFMSQLNATTSRIPIPELGSETQFYDGAITLAAAVVECTLTLIANGEIDIKLVIEDKEPMGSKCKHKSSKTSVWKVEQPNGPPQPFSDTLWGGATRDFMTSLGCVPHAAMNTIIDKASSVAMSQKAKPMPVNSEQQSDRAALAFH